MLRKLRYLIYILVIAGFFIPQAMRIPVQGANAKSYAQDSFWFYPWGESGTHKGVDIFAKSGTAVRSATQGIVVYTGQIGMGGKVVVVLGPKWRFHYYAHLDSIATAPLTVVSAESTIGTVGSTGNAEGKPPHLHYSILTMFPYPWLIDESVQGWKKMFYLNPIPYLNDSRS